jgi:hypothetical protein
VSNEHCKSPGGTQDQSHYGQSGERLDRFG